MPFLKLQLTKCVFNNSGCTRQSKVDSLFSMLSKSLPGNGLSILSFIGNASSATSIYFRGGSSVPGKGVGAGTLISPEIIDNIFVKQMNNNPVYE